MDPSKSGTLTVPGASIYYEVRGEGPLLLLIASGDSDAAVFERMAAVLALEYRVVTYDPRGNSRSPLDGPPEDQRVEEHAEDACRLLDHLAGPDEQVRVFGSCSGGVVALELAIRRQDRVLQTVIHEPPSFGLLPDAAATLKDIDDIHETFRREGAGPALRRFEPFFGGVPAPELPEAHDNTAFFLAHVIRPFSHFVPDLPALAAVADRIVVTGGRASRTYLVHRPAVVLAQRLGQELTLFPGGHIGYAKYPVEFARQLTELFAHPEPPHP
ncbi:alpha/beta fold hydrolase [Streptomyces sp. CBMA152]|uniref:alpha/beta fold hydrolase n=1 Tax=Streptomyces sp. CBMA152 TaxID=1896312 RepID=UPI00166136AE|nr:alpha/beta hydrolase [Streptomyces sp. CBMA152]MBD0741253.1 alpha/beta hydrolase [Streptomyces sp. CBMA152]